MPPTQLAGLQLADFGWALIRLFAGGLIIYFGLEIFRAEQLAGYAEWLTSVGVPYPLTMAYLGKIAELTGGVCLVLGLFTRWAAALLMWVMFVVTFIMVAGDLLSQSFSLLLLFGCFLVAGGGRLSLDELRTRTPTSSDSAASPP